MNHTDYNIEKSYEYYSHIESAIHCANEYSAKNKTARKFTYVALVTDTELVTKNKDGKYTQTEVGWSDDGRMGYTEEWLTATELRYTVDGVKYTSRLDGYQTKNGVQY
jgi:hypothetical protein